MTELCDLAYKYGTDKCPQLKHHFTEFYYTLFPDRMSVKKVVEIGIGKMEPTLVAGASLQMWQEWFPSAMIYGADIDRDLLFQAERIETFYCDQRNASDLRNLIEHTGSDVDLFIDDGSHIPGSQIYTCMTVMPMLSKDSIYVIEDAASTSVDAALRMADYNVQVFQPRHRRYRDDRLIIVRHGNV